MSEKIVANEWSLVFNRTAEGKPIFHSDECLGAWFLEGPKHQDCDCDCHKTPQNKESSA